MTTSSAATGVPGQDANIVRVFSEGIPVGADEKELQQIRAIGGENDSPSRQLARYILEVGHAYSPGIKPMLVFRPDRYLRGGDHSAFNAQGYAAVRFTEYRENFNHQHQNLRTENGVEYGDLLRFVDFDYVARVARLNALTLAALAAAPAAPGEVKMVAAKLDNDSTLKWRPSPGASGYEVLWRATTAPAWEHVQSVGDTTTTTLQDLQGQRRLRRPRGRQGGTQEPAGRTDARALMASIAPRPPRRPLHTVPTARTYWMDAAPSLSYPCSHPPPQNKSS